MKKEAIKIEKTEQIVLAIKILEEKLSRVLPFVPKQITIINGEITVKE